MSSADDDTLINKKCVPCHGGVSDTRIVSPMPCCSSTDMPAVDATMPLLPMPASVRPRCSGQSQRSPSRW